MMPGMTSTLDHLVIVANNLAQGAAWCEATLGITHNAGGEHKLFGTHNLLFKIATPANPMAYCEIIAIMVPSRKMRPRRRFTPSLNRPVPPGNSCNDCWAV